MSDSQPSGSELVESSLSTPPLSYSEGSRPSAESDEEQFRPSSSSEPSTPPIDHDDLARTADDDLRLRHRSSSEELFASLDGLTEKSSHHPWLLHHPDACPSPSSPPGQAHPYTGVGWRLGSKQTDPNIFKDSARLFCHPPRSGDLVFQLPSKSFDPPPDLVPTQEDSHCLRHSEFGFDANEREFMWKSQADNHPSSLSDYSNGDVSDDPEESKKEVCCQQAGYFTYLTTYWSYLLLFLIGHVRDAFDKRFYRQSSAHLRVHNGYAALNSDFDSFFTRRVKSRLDDCFGRPVTGTPARTITLLDRTSSDNCLTFKYTHTTTQALNISSYNYLGFAQSHGACADAVETSISKLSISSSGSRDDVGSSALLIQTEKLMARFLGVEDAMLISQGFATNSTTIPALVGKGALVLSDEFNHNSIRFGVRLSGAMVRTYKHNDINDLERVLKESISQGQPRRLRAWTKILVVVEGIYSMEGSIVDLPSLLRLKEKYKFYLYLDEAHSIGALGPNGRGVCDYYGVDPSRVDVLMGTLTKSFGASGGYVAGTKELVQHMRKYCHSTIYAESLPPPVLSQILSAVQSIMAKESPNPEVLLPEGVRRLRRLAFNARYLRAGLKKLGFIVVGDRDSPVVPLLVYQPGKMLLFSRLMLQRFSIVVVIVGYPGTPLVLGRVRFCVSASHTKGDIDKVLIATNEIGGALGLKLNAKNSNANDIWTVEKVIANARELVHRS